MTNEDKDRPHNVVAFKSASEQEQEYMAEAAAEFNLWLNELADGITLGTVSMALVTYYMPDRDRTERLRFIRPPSDEMAAVGMLALQLNQMMADYAQNGVCYRD